MPSRKSMNFGGRYFVEGFSEFGSLIQGALLYINTQIGELWYRGVSGDNKILKGVKKIL